MAYTLRSQVSFCWVDGRAVFLDAHRDRYFCLDGAAAMAFGDLCEARSPQPQGLADLIRLEVIEAQAGVSPCPAPTRWTPPSQGLPQPLTPPMRRSFKPCLEAGWVALRVRWRLKHRPLRDSLARLGPRKINSGQGSKAQLERISQVAARFLACRRALPLRPVCLPDSLALLEVLAGQGLAADLVFGVRLNPFAAHCWVQAGDTILNDTVDTALRHTPILVV